MGGSQGAAALNERLPAAIAIASRALPGVEVLHQAGRDRDDEVRARYAAEGVARATVVPFIEDVPRAIADADLVVARAGAATIAELSAIGRAAVLVPFPFAADDHQARNAEALERAGGAVCLRQEQAAPPRIAAEIERLLSDDGLRVRMAASARAVGRPGAARDIAADLLELSHTTLRGAA
jgi:UDP-N-acetylglucosamine--N-acetylmuramyl-(pentapeptide) pyrophosphoryl-undecaprenol N-acetylglucosamine transferase